MRVKCLGVVVVAGLVSGGALSAGDGKDAGDKELKKIQGTWKFVSQSMDGKERPPEQLTKLKITFTDDKWSVTVDGKMVQGGTHKFDPTKKPAHVDAKITEGEDKGGSMLGIYELKGDTMKVCFDPKGKERPTDFTGKAGQFAAVVEREKKKS